MTTTLATRPETNGAIQAPTGGGALNFLAAMEELKSIRTFVKEEMVKGTDYGEIPNTNTKPVLLLPGAQKVAMLYNATPKYEVEARELGDGHVEYLVSVDLVHRGSNNVIGSGMGSCSTMEGKYRYRNGERKCPECGKAAIIKGAEQYGGGWLCWKKKDGCGAKFEDDSPSIVSQEVGKVENTNIHDQRNTVLKMAMKRGLVSAGMSLACLAELFTQDLDDTYDLGPEARSSQEPSQATAPAGKSPEQKQTRGSAASKGATRSNAKPAQQQGRAQAAPAQTPREITNPSEAESCEQFIDCVKRITNKPWHDRFAKEGVQDHEMFYPVEPPSWRRAVYEAACERKWMPPWKKPPTDAELRQAIAPLWKDRAGDVMEFTKEYVERQKAWAEDQMGFGVPADPEPTEANAGAATGSANDPTDDDDIPF